MQISKHSHSIQRSNVKNITDWPTLQPVFKGCRHNHGVYINYYLFSSSTVRCWNAVHLWNRCCCHSGRM